MLFNRLKKNLKARTSFLKQEKTNCYRLYDMDIPEYPFIVDIYSENAVVWPKFNEKIDQNPSEKLTELTNALAELLAIKSDHIFIKNRERKKGSSQYEKHSKYSEESQWINVFENDVVFKINLSDYLDCGLFMDHRPLRKQLKKISHDSIKDKSLLNLFSYTCSISVAAALAGFKTTSVDLSNTYLNWGKENFKLNDLKPEDHEFLKKSAISFLEDEKNINEKFDIIFLDPPTFSNSSSMENIFEVEKDHPFLVEECVKRLKPEGVLYFSNNKRKFSLSSEIAENYNVKDVSEKSIPLDFRDKKIHSLFEIRDKK